MAQAEHQDDVKQKVQAVREVISERNKNDIHLVLQYFEYDVPKTIQAFLDGSAEEALGEWQFSGHKQAGPKKKKKSKNKAKDTESSSASSVAVNSQESRDSRPAPSIIAAVPELTVQPIVNGEITTDPIQDSVTLNGSIATTNAISQSPQTTLTTNHTDIPAEPKPSIIQPSTTKQGVNQTQNKQATSQTQNKQATSQTQNKQATSQSIPTTAQTASQPTHIFSYKSKPAEKPPERSTDGKVKEGEKAKTNQINASQNHHATESVRPKTLEALGNKGRERTFSETSSTTPAGQAADSKTQHRGLDKSQKDLQRQISSLIRLKSILLEECEKAQKNIATSFEQARNALQDREVEMIVEMEKIKSQAVDILSGRQKQGSELKVRTDRVSMMSELEFLELRADIKHFVSDRKVDEDLASSTKFECDIDGFLKEIKSFGSVLPLKNNYTTRRPSISSLSLSSSIGPTSPPATPVSPPTPLSVPTPLSTPSPSVPVNPVPPAVKLNPPSLHNLTGAKVVSQSESLTQFESCTEIRTLGSKPRDQSRSSSTRRSTTPAGRARSAGRGQRSQPNKGKGQADSASEGKPSPDDNKKSRNARRRQRQKERIREQNESRKTSDASSVGAPGDDRQQRANNKLNNKAAGDAMKQNQDKAKAGKAPGSDSTSDKTKDIKSGSDSKGDKDAHMRGNARGGRTPSPTKRFQQRGQGDAPRQDSVAPNQKEKAKVTSRPQSSRGRGGQRSRSRVDDRKDKVNAAGDQEVRVNGSLDTHSHEKQENEAQNTPNLKSNDTDKQGNETVDASQSKGISHSESTKLAAVEKEKKILVKEEFRYSDSKDLNSSHNSKDLKETNNNKMLNGDIYTDFHPKDTSDTVNSVCNGEVNKVTNGDVSCELNDSNNSNNIDSLPQRKPRPNRSANRKPLKCDVIIGQEPMKNGDCDLNEVDQHRWSNEDD